LGTYFPRSYAELFCITDSFLERLNVICGLPNDGKMSILDVGCGSGGALTGILWAIRRQRHDLPHISITAIDGNATAMATLTSIVDRTRQCWRSTDIKLQTYTEEITTTFPTKMLTGKMFDIIVTSKLLCELSTSGEDAYSGFLKAYAPYLAEQGILLILDVPTKTDTESNYNPNRMLTATNDFVRSSQNAFGTVLPLPCATNGQTCRQGCFMTRTFAVRTSRNARIESDVCFTVIARKSLADKLLAFVAPERRGTQCRPFPDPSKGEEQVTPQDPFCL
jgi:SAM-dependent methyltransferase